MNEKLPTEDMLIVAVVVRWTVQAVEMAAVLSGERRWCVIEADCLHVLPWLPDKSVSHVLTDPPYEAEAHTLQRQVKVEGGGGVYGKVGARPLDFAPITANERVDMAAHTARVASGWALVFCQAEGISPWRDAFAAAGARWRRAGIWVKPDAQPQLSGDRWAQGYEAIASVWCGQGRSRWNGGGRSGVFVHCKQDTANGKKAPHPTTKPINLMLELVGLFTDPGEVILDAFAGSGTTGVAALRLGRRAILIERDAKYAAIARQRMEAERRGQNLKEYRAGQRTLWEA